jgi:hypothetical protein
MQVATSGQPIIKFDMNYILFYENVLNAQSLYMQIVCLRC